MRDAGRSRGASVGDDRGAEVDTGWRRGQKPMERKRKNEAIVIPKLERWIRDAGVAFRDGEGGRPRCGAHAGEVRLIGLEGRIGGCGAGPQIAPASRLPRGCCSSTEVGDPPARCWWAQTCVHHKHQCPNDDEANMQSFVDNSNDDPISTPSSCAFVNSFAICTYATNL